ncbi:MAG: hypothetical protein WCC97_12125 [Candidatus Acidiferrales bacterium]
MNVAAVVHRYGQDEPARQRSLDCEFHPELPGSDARVYRALCYLLHQCCEGDIPATKLFQSLTTICLKIAHGLIAETPEYQRAEWEYGMHFAERHPKYLTSFLRLIPLLGFAMK